MVTQTNDVVAVEASGLVRVCAWCVPAYRLAELHRAHRCTDGLCESCQRLLTRPSTRPVTDVERLIEETQRVGR